MPVADVNEAANRSPPVYGRGAVKSQTRILPAENDGRSGRKGQPNPYQSDDEDDAKNNTSHDYNVFIFSVI
jgi:hypothetical protein